MPLNMLWTCLPSGMDAPRTRKNTRKVAAHGRRPCLPSIARSTGSCSQALLRRSRRRVPPPVEVHTAREHMVQQVVAARDAAEHALDLLAFGHGASKPSSSQDGAASQSEGAREGPFIYRISDSPPSGIAVAAARIPSWRFTAGGGFIAGRGSLLLALRRGLAVLHAGRSFAHGRGLATRRFTRGRGAVEVPLEVAVRRPVRDGTAVGI